MQPSDFEFLCRFLLESSGLNLGPGKEYLVEGRLTQLAQSLGLSGISDLVVELRSGRRPDLAKAITESMTTNETLWFRDKIPFDELSATVLPPMLETRKGLRRLKIWCAACSTGQEPYSLVMTLLESFPELANWSLQVVCTDIDTQVIERAKKGAYTQFEVQRGMPIKLLVKYFDQQDKLWQIKPAVQKWNTYRQLNLLKDFSILGQFDLIMCRNVLIYFETKAKQDVLQRMARQLAPDGALMLGAAETIMGIASEFERRRDVKSAIFSLAGAKSASARV